MELLGGRSVDPLNHSKNGESGMCYRETHRSFSRRIAISLSFSALDRVNCIFAMIALDDLTRCSRRFPYSAIADTDGVILTILAGGCRSIASRMKCVAGSCKAFPGVV